MKIVIVLFFLSSFVNAQPPAAIKDSAAINIMEGLPANEPFDTARYWKKADAPYLYILSSNDLYTYFGWQQYMKRRDFDFANFHILGTRQCRQCRLHCRHDEGRRECHRNRCMEEWVWAKRDNNKAFTEIPSETFPGHAGLNLKEGQRSFLRDTVIQEISDTTTSLWYTSGYGDCHATFEYRLYADKYQPVLVLKEWNYWGGCRAGGGWDFTVSFKKHLGSLYYIKRTLLMDKREE